ncbi:MAG TPA: hypothetical protein PLV68_06800, partial [Ilumatobacteraceae bacterium]|nr:hypothetical protein [Ilumatobacteraceae bacterium]
MDLTPRASDPSAPAAPLAARVAKRRKWLSLALLAAVVVAGGVVVTMFLTNALDYYCNVDEVGPAGAAGVKSNCELDRQIRIQGR